MKLSEKGKRKILDNRYWFSEEFDQGDFEGAVVLTVEEAKTLMRILYDNAEHLDCLYESSKEDYLFLEEISKRIGQAEKK